MPIPGIEQPELLVLSPELRLRRFDGRFDFAWDWYQDAETLLLLDGVDRPYDRAKLERMYSFLNQRGELYFIEALEDGGFVPIGDVTFWREDMPIVIGNRAYRGRGIGKQVVRALIQRGKELGYAQLFVREIYSYNRGSQRLFTSLGFAPCEPTEQGWRYRLDLGGWFTVESIDRDTYAISEYGHWEETHCYLLLGGERCLLIDSGLGVGDLGAQVRALCALPVQVATTHVHWDHIGGHRHFSHIAVHERESAWLDGGFPIPLSQVRRSLAQGNPAFPPGFDSQAYQLFQGRPQALLRDGDVLDLGGRRVQVWHTPGHSPGHICFFEPERGYLYTGDLIYQGRLDAFYPTTDPVSFAQSVRRVKALPVRRVLPGHHELNIPVSLIGEIDAGFSSLQEQGALKQGSGVFSFPRFSIHL